MSPAARRKDDIYVEVVENLKQQVDNLTVERDLAVKLWQEAVKEIDSLDFRQYCSAEKSHADQLQNLAGTLETKYQEVVEMVNLKTKVYSETDLKHCNMEQKLTRDNDRLKRTIANLENQLGQLKQTCDEKNAAEMQMKSAQSERQQQISLLEQQLDACLTDRNYFQNLSNSLQNTCQELRQRTRDSENVSLEAVEEMSKLVAVVESSAAVKGQALQCAQQMTEESQQLQKALANLIATCSEDTRQAVERVRDLANANLLKAIDELHRSELDKAEARADQEAARREKCHYQELYHSLMSSLRDQENYQLLEERCSGDNQLVINLQRERDYLEHQMETMKRAWQVDNNSHVGRQQDLNNEIDQLRRNSSQLQTCVKANEAELISVRKENRELQQTLKATKQQLYQLRKENRLSEEMSKQNRDLTLQKLETKCAAELSSTKHAFKETRRLLLGAPTDDSALETGDSRVGGNAGSQGGASALRVEGEEETMRLPCATVPTKWNDCLLRSTSS